MPEREQILQSKGSMVVDRNGAKIGNIEDIYLDKETNEPE